MNEILKNFAFLFKVIIAVLLLVFCAWYAGTQFVGEEYRAKQRLAEQYHIPTHAVSFEPKPHGCEYQDAPLGAKHCHYEMVENVIPVGTICDQECRSISLRISWRRVED